MKEYTFLGSHSFRSQHVRAHTLREAWRVTKQWYNSLSLEQREHMGHLTHSYQDAKDGDMVMSGWKFTRDKKIK